MSSNSPETERLSDELIADFIETGDFQGPRGFSGAIEYLTKKDLSALRTRSERNALSNELRRVSRAEASIIDGFSAFVPSWRATVVLTEHEKTKNIRPFISEIAMLFRLRNRRNPEELRKLEVLESKNDTPEYALRIDFWTDGNEKAFIKSIRIEKTRQGDFETPLEGSSKGDVSQAFV